MESPATQMHGAHGCFYGGPKGDGGRQMSTGTGKQKWGGAGVGVGGVRPAGLKFIIHLHSPKHALEATV